MKCKGLSRAHSRCREHGRVLLLSQWIHWHKRGWTSSTEADEGFPCMSWSSHQVVLYSCTLDSFVPAFSKRFSGGAVTWTGATPDSCCSVRSGRGWVGGLCRAGGFWLFDLFCNNFTAGELLQPIDLIFKHNTHFTKTFPMCRSSCSLWRGIYVYVYIYILMRQWLVPLFCLYCAVLFSCVSLVLLSSRPYWFHLATELFSPGLFVLIWLCSWHD